MNVLSLFDGISCGQLALQRAGVRVDNYFASEIEQASIKVTQKNFPKTIQLGDVCAIRAEGLPKIDLLIGGSPCQSFSQAISSNTGFDGKSKLFFEYVRLLNELKPKYFLLENVPMKPEWEQVITDHLGVEPIKLNSDLFSAQSRERLYWTNIPVQTLMGFAPDLVLADVLQPAVDVPEKYWYKEAWSLTHTGGAVVATLDIKGHDILRRVNSAFHPCQTLTAVCGGNQQKKVLQWHPNEYKWKPRKLTPLEYERLQTVPDGYTDCVSDSARYKALGNGWTVDVIAHLFTYLSTKGKRP